MGIPFDSPPLIAEVLVYTASDSIIPVGAGDAGGAFALANIIDPNNGPNLQLPGRTNRASVNDGFKITLATETEISAVEVLGVSGDPLPAGMLGLSFAHDSVAAFSFWTGDNEEFRPTEIFSGHSSTVDDPVNVGWIMGYDDLSVPSKTTPPTVVTGLCKHLWVETQTAGASYFEAGYVAIGTSNFEVLPKITYSQIKTTSVKLNGGYGYRTTVSWPLMPADSAEFLLNLWKKSAGGQFPILFYPAPGSKSSSGTLADSRNLQSLRGGVMRMLRAPTMDLAVDSVVLNATNVQLSLESWQEFPTGGR